MEFADHVVLVTGGGGGIGTAIARAFVREGAAVALVDVSLEAARAVAEVLSGEGHAAMALAGDVSVEADCRQVVAETLRALGRPIEVLVNNAGISGLVAPVVEMELATWNETLAVNVTGAMLMSRETLKMMLPRRRGSIINIASHVGKRAIAFRSPYVASKFAMIGLTQCMALEVAPFGIRVNAVCPGPVEGDRLQRSIQRAAAVRGVSAEVAREAWLAESPMRRMVTPEEVAAVTIFLASSKASGMTGQAINVTAGRIMH